MHTYVLKDVLSPKEITHTIELPKELDDIVYQAEWHYKLSKRYIVDNWYFTWRDCVKQYLMDKTDRYYSMKDKSASNFCVGTVRKNVDALASTVTETKIQLSTAPANDEAYGKEIIVDRLLNYIADQNRSHYVFQSGLRRGLTEWTFAFRQTMGTKWQEISTIQFVNGHAQVVKIQTEKSNIPMTEACDIFSLFPDPYNGNLRYVTERKSVSPKSFFDAFLTLIKSPLNQSPLKDDKFLSLLPVNPNGSDFSDYGNVRNQIFMERNKRYEADDQLMKYSGSQIEFSGSSNINTYDELSEVVENMIEYKITWYSDRCVLLANNYPVYVGANPYEFIPYVIVPATDSGCRFGEWLPVMIWPLGEADDVIFNNLIDGVRATMNPTFLVQRQLLIDEKSIGNNMGTAGWVVFVDWPNAIQRLDKGGVSENGALWLLTGQVQTLSGVSDANLWAKTGERTATWAQERVSSDNRRMVPYVQRFAMAVSEVSRQWLLLCQKFWKEGETISYLGEDGVLLFEQIKSRKDIAGAFIVSTDIDGFARTASGNRYSKMLAAIQTLWPTGVIDPFQLGLAAAKELGLPSNVIKQPPVPQAPMPPEWQPPLPPEIPQPSQPDMTNDQQTLMMENSDQVNLGNWNTWQ